jgi:5-methyltetrahydropteroyltriglutamate--homocysteine methyltransferase
MKRSDSRILTTHVGSLARPHSLLRLMQAAADGELSDRKVLDDAIAQAVSDAVRHQVETGIDIVTDGEQGKTGFYAYVRERLSGFEHRSDVPVVARARREREAFPEYYERYFKRDSSNVGDRAALVCTGPIKYAGHEALQRDIANLKRAVAGLNVTEVFMPSAGPRSMGLHNEYYPTQQDYLAAIAEAMREEYRAIIDAGFVLQLDDPSITDIFSEADVATREERRRGVAQSVEIINHSLRGLPEDRIRFHTCYGINEGPRIFDAPMEDIADLVLQIHAGAYSFEAGNPRHDHDFHVFETVKLPEGKLVIPGVISHTTNMVEHPEVIAQRLINYANVVGRENVIAGADCGFSSQASYVPDVDDRIVWHKFQALAEGARLASQRLWR